MVLFCIGVILVLGVCLGRFYLNINVGWTFVCFELSEGTTSSSGSVASE